MDSSCRGFFDVRIGVPNKLLYAFSHNRIPVVRKLVISDAGASVSGTVRVDLELNWSREQRPPARKHSFTIEAPQEPGAQIEIRDVELKLDDAVMADLDEAAPAILSVTLTTRDERVQREELEVQILARNEWVLVEGYEELLASYVQPNHPITKEILKDASKILARDTGKGSLEGYQSGSERALAIGKAVFEALQARKLTYIDPPASFENNQKVRPLDEVLEGSAGTCIDLACAYASCLEQAGLHPLIWISPGHAFAGFLLQGDDLGAAVERDTNKVINLTDAGLAVAAETIHLTEVKSFAEAVEATRVQLVPTSEFVLIDVHRAHRTGSLPLPARVVRDGILTVVVDPGPGTAPMVERTQVATGKRLEDSTPIRITRWKSSLLDLTFRNPLLNFTTGRQGLDLLVPAGKLAALEDKLMSGGNLKIMPGDVLEGRQTAAGLRHVTEVTSEALTDLYSNLGLLYTTFGEVEAKKRARALAARARLIESETGSNSLYLAFGKLVWHRKVQGGSKEVESPLFLLPVRLARHKSRALFVVQADEGELTSPNYSLVEKLKGEHNLSVPEFEKPAEDEAGIDVAAAIGALRREIANKGLPFRVDETAHLAVLQFSRSRLWKDMDEYWREFLENDVVKHMVENPGAPYMPQREEAKSDAEEEAELAILCPVPADGAQLRAIGRALKGDSFVLQGPPGTGKSQTITNLLASALARGKSVLFVAEKQAALSVVSDRLRAVGLAPYCLDLHDKGSKGQEIRQQLKEALDARPRSEEALFEEVQAKLGGLQKLLTDYRDSVYGENSQGYSYASAYEETLRLGDGISAEVPVSALFGDGEKLASARKSLMELEPTVHAAKPSKEHPWSFVLEAEFAGIDRPALSGAIQALNDSLERTRDVPKPVRDLLDAALTVFDLRDVATLLGGIEVGRVPSEEVREAIANGDWSGSVSKALDSLRRPAERVNVLRKKFGKAALERPIGDLDGALDELNKAAGSFFLMRRGKARQALQALLKAPVPPKLSAQECLKVGSDIVATRKAFQSRLASLEKAAMSPLPDGFDPDELPSYPAMEDWISGVQSVGAACSRQDEFGDKLRAAAGYMIGQPGLAQNVRSLAEAVEGLFERLPVSTDEIGAWIGGAPILAKLQSVLLAWLADALDDRFLRLQRWLELCGALQPAKELGLSAFVDDVLAGAVPAEEVGVAFNRGLVAASLRERAAVNGLDSFDRVNHERAIARYTQGIDERERLLRERIPVMLSEARGFDPTVGFGEVHELRLELNKRNRTLSIRNLLRKFPQLIQKLTPCFLMSPSSVSQFIEPGSMKFDLVVFDEASQIDVAEAVGAMGRARSVIIVGDSKQMPPTRVFEAGIAEDEIATLQVEDADEAPEDGESLLMEAVDSIQMDQEWLTWHYRSQDETLIAFSNDKYYENGLSSFPSPFTGVTRALSWHPVNGQFSHGRQRTNPTEAKAVVEEILRRLHDPVTQGDSIGVVTLNSQQQDEVLRQLEETGDERVLELLNLETDESLLVRNLENIQGQERDVMMLSTGFSKPVGGGKLPLNFGPLNRQGGERRLNVAITRARRELLVFCSFEPEDIEEERSNAVGLHHLRDFLFMAKHGPKRSAVSSADRERMERYRDEVKAALEERGLEVEVDMGLSPFKVDLAARPVGAGEWRAAILLDGARWQTRSSVVDRDALPVKVLGGLMGWPAVLRVWLPAWLAERDEVADDLAKTVREADAPVAPRPSALDKVTLEGEEGTGADESKADPGEPAPLIPPRPDLPTRVQFANNGDGSALNSFGFGGGLEEFTAYPTDPQLGKPEECGPDYVSASVKRALEEAIEFEGPVELHRLAKLVAARFGISRLHESRASAIKALVPKAQRRSSQGVTFVWPKGANPETYASFRFPLNGDGRSIQEIAPEEIGNAMRYLVKRANSMQQGELIKETASSFGIQRVTENIEGHLKRACLQAVASGRLKVVEGRYLPPVEGP